MSAENIVGVTREKVSTLGSSEPPDDRFCDLVMKGGITSGVVYPRAISLLSHHYRFRGIGGTSAGAIAAAITAAAEYQRREKNGSRKGFNLLENLPRQLGSEAKKGKRKLLSLFQPQPSTRRLFAVLVRTLNKGSTKSRWFSVFKGLLIAYWPATVLSIIVTWAIAQSGAWFAAFLLLVIALPLSIGTWVYLDITEKMVANGFGLCNGMSEEKDVDALTPWLHDMIQKAAGLGKEDDPLTFGDLWNAKGFPPTWIKIPEGVTKRSIDLQMFSTNLAHGRPYVFPLAEPETGESRFKGHERLYFTEAEMRQYFPPEVVKWMVDHSPTEIERKRKEKSTPGEETKEKTLSVEDGKDMLELPEPKNFPVLLATRMSLAFPFLISAIPLYALDPDLSPEERKFHRCWFSDGGISSNFPIHLFDGLVPIWPTFGIHLEPAIDGQEESYLPSIYDEGYAESWSLFAEKVEPAGRLGGFISAIVNAMQNWNDNTVRLMPGFRDRVARVRLKEGEGGMNLDMEPPIIDTLAERGKAAANKLIQCYAIQPSQGEEAPGWDQHRFVRFNNLLMMMKARTPGLVEALGNDCRYATKLEDLLQKFSCATDESGMLTPPPGYEEPMTQKEKDAYKRLVAALNALATEMLEVENNIPFKPIPKPEPELRVRPPL
ncbi:Patatin-like phospholipase [Nitrosospira multiformis]|uniref:Patatin-like phospholipase n=1 Tax=Nitrosospira multiformis TaxID=1231 RepID=A0A1I0F9C0_9PROT|nr:patatin-like phospholipase family protein [Nitrosospira multiformis]SET54412.1 Patatin-like phospholipase [Nitrosospira multiformis]